MASAGVGIGRQIVHPRALLHLMWLHLLCLLKRGASAWAGTMVFTGIVSSRLAPFNPNHSSNLFCAYGWNSVIALQRNLSPQLAEGWVSPPPLRLLGGGGPTGHRWSHREPSFWECVECLLDCLHTPVPSSGVLSHAVFSAVYCSTAVGYGYRSDRRVVFQHLPTIWPNKIGLFRADSLAIHLFQLAYVRVFVQWTKLLW
jgi:hypothetical protein